MSHPPQDPQGYPWGPPEPPVASPRPPSGASPQQAAPQPPLGDPQSPPGDPYGGGQYSGQWSQQGVQQAPYTGVPYGPGPGAPVRHGGVPTSTIVLLVVSGVSFFTGFLTLASLAPLVLSIVAMARAGRDPAGARHLTKIGWIVYAVVAVLSLIAVVVGLVALARYGNSTGYSTGGISTLGALGALGGVRA